VSVSETRVVGGAASPIEVLAAAGVRDPATTFPCFDGLRAIAAVTVVLHHASFPTGKMFKGYFAPFFTHLDVGVAVFFLISGFLLYRPFVAAALDGRPGPSVRRFFKRRLLRIYPAYWLALVSIIVFFGLPVPVHGALSYVEYFSLFQIYDNLHRASGGISQAWTLSVELSFYAFLPAYAWLMRVASDAVTRLLRSRRWISGRPAEARVRFEVAGVVGLYAVSVGFRGLVFALRSGRVHDLGIYWLPANLDYFALGMGLAVASAWLATRDTNPPLAELVGRLSVLWWLIAFVCFFIVSKGLRLPVGLVRVDGLKAFARQFLYGATAFFLLLPAVFGHQDRGPVRKFLRWGPMVYLGLISYGIYLWHQAWISKAFAWQNRPVFLASFAAVFTTAFAWTLVTASVSWFLLERPLLRVRDRTRAAPAPVTGSAP
jgi:peptidoglycan/LPS O-acetylase OafA/YrhL